MYRKMIPSSQKNKLVLKEHQYLVRMLLTKHKIGFISSSAIYSLYNPGQIACFSLLIYEMGMKILNHLLGLLEPTFYCDKNT